MGNKINNIQALRFFAAFSVALFHLPFIKHGSWGVDFFFVISGFIMAYISENRTKHFLLKRLIRIIPLYWILSIAIFLMAMLKPEVLNFTTANYGHLLKSILFIPFDKDGAGHFPILFLGWSLNYEFLFYIIFTLSLFFFKKKRTLVCSFILILIFMFSTKFSDKNFILQVYSSSIILEFIYGMLIYEFFKLKTKNGTINVNINATDIFLMFLTFFTASLSLYFKSTDIFDVPRIFTYGMLGAFLLLFFLLILKNNFFPKVFVLLGDASFSIYLIHPFVIQFFYKISPFDSSNFFFSLVVGFVAIVFTLFISILVYSNFEKPLNIKIKKFLGIV